MTDWDKRCCVVCSEPILVLQEGSRRRYHCLNAPIEAGQGPSLHCWTRRFPNCGAELLAALPPVAIRTAKARTAYAEIVALIADVAASYEAGHLTRELATDLLAKYGVKRLRAAVRRMGPKSSVGAMLSAALPPPPTPAPQNRYRPDQARADALLALPPEFAQSLEEWRETCRRIQRIKHERDIKNADNTTRRSIRDAEWLCVFLAGIGLQHWEEMAPRHYTLFRLEHGLSAAVTVYRFLKYVKSRHARMKATFSRPQMPKSPVTERLTDRGLAVKAIQAAADAGDARTALLLCLIGLYAQPLTECQKLAVGRFRVIDGNVACKFNELWMPLDRVTAALLTRHLASLGCGENALSDSGEAGVCLFGIHVQTLSEHVRKYTNVPIPKLRLTAVANVIAQGVLDRNGIHRAFGVSMPTIADVERIFGWQVQSEVSPEARAHRRRMLNGELTNA